MGGPEEAIGVRWLAGRRTGAAPQRDDEGLGEDREIWIDGGSGRVADGGREEERLAKEQVASGGGWEPGSLEPGSLGF